MGNAFPLWCRIPQGPVLRQKATPCKPKNLCTWERDSIAYIQVLISSHTLRPTHIYLTLSMPGLTLPPFPDDIPTHPLLVIDYALLKAGVAQEKDRLWKAATGLGFW